MPNPYITPIGKNFHINADGQDVKTVKAKELRSPFGRFIEKIVVSETRFYGGSPCWEWSGCTSRSTGYGQFRIDARRGAKKSSPHVFAYQYFNGEIPQGFEIDHLCRNRSCASPFHLEAVPLQENRRRRDAAKTHCKQGHEFTPENTRVGTNGRRFCKACNRIRVARFLADNPDYEKRKQFPCRLKERNTK